MTNNSEPVYTFVKGRGWIIGYDPIVICRCGTRVRLERRMPVSGERYFRTGISNDAPLEQWLINHPTTYRFVDFKPYSSDSKHFDACVLVPVEFDDNGR